MTKFIPTPTMGEILKEEFMEPFNISAYRLAKDIQVPVSRIQDILNDRRKITPDTSIRLARYFGVSERYFLKIQNDIDIRNLLLKSSDEYNRIQALTSSPDNRLNADSRMLEDTRDDFLKQVI